MTAFKSILAAVLSALIAVQSAQALPYGSASSASQFKISLPGSLGFVSDSYSPSSRISQSPDVILIQDLHVNRSVQFVISKILKRLKDQGLMPDRVAVEGDTGPIDIQSMQKYPDSAIRKQAADYLVQQGEMPGAMHFAVSEGEGGLFGIETDEYYQANLEMFRRSYKGRNQVRQEIEKLQAVLPRLKKDAAVRENAAILEKDVQAVSQLINNQVIPEELPQILARASTAVEHLKLVLPKVSAGRGTGNAGEGVLNRENLLPHSALPATSSLVESLSASINFYALALLRDEELFKNAMAVRQFGRQKTTIMVTGGFHTQALAKMCKVRSLSYAVITPNIRKHDKVDERLYVERLLGRHISPEQLATGRNWALEMVQPYYAAKEVASRFFGGISSRALRMGIIGVLIALVAACANPTAPSDAAIFSIKHAQARERSQTGQIPMARDIMYENWEQGVSVKSFVNTYWYQDGPEYLTFLIDAISEKPLSQVDLRFQSPDGKPLLVLQADYVTDKDTYKRYWTLRKQASAKETEIHWNAEIQERDKGGLYLSLHAEDLRKLNVPDGFWISFYTHEVPSTMLRRAEKIIEDVQNLASAGPSAQTPPQDFEQFNAKFPGEREQKPLWQQILDNVVTRTHAQTPPAGAPPQEQRLEPYAIHGPVKGHSLMGPFQFEITQTVDHVNVLEADYVKLNLRPHDKSQSLTAVDIEVDMKDVSGDIHTYRVTEMRSVNGGWFTIPREPGKKAKKYIDPRDPQIGFQGIQVIETRADGQTSYVIRIPVNNFKPFAIAMETPVDSIGIDTSQVAADGVKLNPRVVPVFYDIDVVSVIPKKGASAKPGQPSVLTQLWGNIFPRLQAQEQLAAERSDSTEGSGDDAPVMSIGQLNAKLVEDLDALRKAKAEVYDSVRQGIRDADYAGRAEAARDLIGQAEHKVFATAVILLRLDLDALKPWKKAEFPWTSFWVYMAANEPALLQQYKARVEIPSPKTIQRKPAPQKAKPGNPIPAKKSTSIKPAGPETPRRVTVNYQPARLMDESSSLGSQDGQVTNGALIALSVLLPTAIVAFAGLAVWAGMAVVGIVAIALLAVILAVIAGSLYRDSSARGAAVYLAGISMVIATIMRFIYGTMISSTPSVESNLESFLFSEFVWLAAVFVTLGMGRALVDGLFPPGDSEKSATSQKPKENEVSRRRVLAQLATSGGIYLSIKYARPFLRVLTGLFSGPTSTDEEPLEVPDPATEAPPSAKPPTALSNPVAKVSRRDLFGMFSSNAHEGGFSAIRMNLWMAPALTALFVVLPVALMNVATVPEWVVITSGISTCIALACSIVLFWYQGLRPLAADQTDALKQREQRRATLAQLVAALVGSATYIYKVHAWANRKPQGRSDPLEPTYPDFPTQQRPPPTFNEPVAPDPNVAPRPQSPEQKAPRKRSIPNNSESRRAFMARLAPHIPLGIVLLAVGLAVMGVGSAPAEGAALIPVPVSQAAGMGVYADIALRPVAALSAYFQHVEEQQITLRNLYSTLSQISLKTNGFTASIFAIPAGFAMGFIVRQNLEKETSRLRSMAYTLRAA